MPDDDKKPRHPETNFLPPLNMILAFFKKRKPDAKDLAKDESVKEESDEKVVEKIIEKLNKDK